MKWIIGISLWGILVMGCTAVSTPEAPASGLPEGDAGIRFDEAAPTEPCELRFPTRDQSRVAFEANLVGTYFTRPYYEPTPGAALVTCGYCHADGQAAPEQFGRAWGIEAQDAQNELAWFDAAYVSVTRQNVDLTETYLYRRFVPEIPTPNHPGFESGVDDLLAWMCDLYTQSPEVTCADQSIEPISLASEICDHSI